MELDATGAEFPALMSIKGGSWLPVSETRPLQAPAHDCDIMSNVKRLLMQLIGKN